MEFLDLQLDDMEVIEQRRPEFDFPAVSFSKYSNSFTAFLNKHAVKALNNCKYVKIYANAWYVVILPVQKRDYHCFQVHYASSKSASISCMGLERCQLEGKVYKLYNTEKGFALKINNPIKVRKE